MKGFAQAIGAVALGLPIVSSTIVINEIADKGTSSGVCNGIDWIELFNGGVETVNLGADGYALHDNKGFSDPDKFSFPLETVIQSQGYLLLCSGATLIGTDEMDPENDVPDPLSPQFGIGKDDTVTLVKVLLASDNATSVLRTTTVEVVDSVELPGIGSQFGVSYARDPATSQFQYTSSPTPGAENIISAIKPEAELEADLKAKLQAQDEMGIKFFGMDRQGLPVTNESFPVVMDLHVTMMDEHFAALVQNPTFETYQPFETATLKNPDTGEEVWSRSIPGRIRTKGQSTLFMGVCLGTETLPFQLDLSAPDNALDQSLFGVEKLYFRHHMSDYSYMRDWAFHRMLARFGLPHVRARKAQLFINGKLMGFYTVLEAPDQDYVFARNFPEFDPQNYALYKVKALALGCGAYTEEEKRNATVRAEELEKQYGDEGFPLSFERGEHQPPIEEHGLFGADQCYDDFLTNLWSNFVDVVVAYNRNDQDCGKMLVDDGLVDLDLGSKDFDKSMKDFLNRHFRYDRKCDPGCANSDISGEMDVEQALKTIAFYAVLVVSDSPIISGNNFYLANTGDGAGWKFVPYDFNQAGVAFCAEDVCNKRAVHWSIARPTCESLEEQQLVGPLLSDPELHKKYLAYAREFLDNVLGDASLHEELETHVNAIAPYMRDDFWSIFGAYVDKELSAEAADWRDEEDRFPLLATLKARVEDLNEQFTAIDAGAFPRGPHIGEEGDNEPWETCADWRASTANRTSCEMECMYHGCHNPDYTVPSWCDEETGKCYHGDYDEQCDGIYDEDRYPGMEDTEDGRRTFCRFAKGFPVKTAECPAPGAIKPLVETSSACSLGALAGPLLTLSSFLGFFAGLVLELY